MPRRDVSTPPGEKCLSYASRLLELGALLAILGVLALAGCYISRTIDQATASDVNNRNFTFANGGVFNSALNNASTALAFSNNAQNFALCSGSNKATGTNRFGSCTLTVTNSDYSANAGPQTNDMIKLDPCDFDSDNKTLTVSNRGVTVTSTVATTTTGTDCSTAIPANATNMSNQNCTFANGGVFDSALTNKETRLAFNSSAQSFTLTSANVNGTATGTSSFGSGCSLTVTTGYPSGTGPQVGTIVLNPCTFDSSNNTLTATHGGLTVTSASCTLGST